MNAVPGARIAPPSIWPRTEPVLPIPLPSGKNRRQGEGIFCPPVGFPTHPNGQSTDHLADNTLTHSHRRMIRSAPALPLILAFSPAPLTLRRGEGISRRPATCFLLSPKLFHNFGERPGEGPNHNPAEFLQARAGARPCPAGEEFFPRLASVAQQGEGKGEGCENASLIKAFAGSPGARPHPPAAEPIRARAAPHPGLLPGSANAAPRRRKKTVRSKKRTGTLLPA
jgi:hypothetical protein